MVAFFGMLNVSSIAVTFGLLRYNNVPAQLLRRSATLARMAAASILANSDDCFSSVTTANFISVSAVTRWSAGHGQTAVAPTAAAAACSTDSLPKLIGLLYIVSMLALLSRRASGQRSGTTAGVTGD